MIHGSPHCPDCATDHVTCDGCHQLYHTQDMHRTPDGPRCGACIRHNYTPCMVCGEYVRDREVERFNGYRGHAHCMNTLRQRVEGSRRTQDDYRRMVDEFVQIAMTTDDPQVVGQAYDQLYQVERVLNLDREAALNMTFVRRTYDGRYQIFHNQDGTATWSRIENYVAER